MGGGERKTEGRGKGAGGGDVKGLSGERLNEA